MKSASALASSQASAPAARRGPGRPTLSNEALLDKALDIFLDKGFERTSMDAITASAGMAKRTVYLRYGDKLSLFKAALQRAIEDWIVSPETLRAAETEDLEETLLKVGQILLDNIMSPAGLRLLRITNAEAGRMPEIGAYTYAQGTGRTVSYLADLFQRRLGISAGDAEQAALGFLYLVVTGPPMMTVWGMKLDDAAIDQHARFCVRLFLQGLLPREDGGVQPTTKSAAEPADLAAENRRLRDLLVEAMLENQALKQRPSVQA